MRRGTSRKKSTAADKRRHIVQIRFVEGTTTDAIASLLQGVMASGIVEQLRSATPGIQASAKAMLRENFQAIKHKFPKAEKKQNAIATVKSQGKRVKVKA